MKRKRLVFTLSLCALLSSCSLKIDWERNSASSGKGVSSSDDSSYSSPEGGATVSKSFPNAKAYLGSLQKDHRTSLPCVYFDFAEDVPYVSLTDYYESFFKSAFGAAFFKVSGGKVTNQNTRKSLVFDVSSNSISSDDYDSFINYTGAAIPCDIFNAISSTADPLSSYDSKQSSYKKGNKVTYNLSNYHMSLAEYEDEIYAPFAILDSLTTLTLGYRFVWNGCNFYCVDPGFLFSNGQLTSYGESYYGGDYNSSSRSESFAEYNYYSFVFEMSNFYGRYHALGTTDLDAYLDKKGLKSKIMSTSSYTSDEAIAEAINSIFGDGGHTYFKNRGFGCGYNADKDKELMKELASKDNRYGEANSVYSELYNYRAQYGQEGNGLFAYNSTAVIRFDEFSLTLNDGSPTKESVEMDNSSTFALFYKSFKEIAENSSIKNVVFDVAMNSGGAAMALGHALSFLTDDAISLSAKNYNTGATFKEVIYVDDDFDGDAKDADSYANAGYNFYILTSESSFSCANAFPCIAKDNNWAKIIGQRSGGGDCIVASGCTPDGTMYSMSGSTSLIHEDGSSFDDGAEVDYEIDYSHFYDLEYLDSFLSSIA